MRVSLILTLALFIASPIRVRPAEIIEIRGRIVCLSEEMQRLYQAAIPTTHDHLLGFKTNDGTYYTLLRTRKSIALFLDDRLRERELILKGIQFPKSSVFESHTIRSVKDGVVHDLFYYCDICAIESVTPEECACCQQPVILTEHPLSQK